MKNNFKLVIGLALLVLIFIGNSNVVKATVISGNTCTYKSEVATWSSCSVGLRYATAVSFATTTSSSATCVDTPTIQACGQDIDGNDFGIINVGSQTWMADNLKTTRYNNGSAVDGGVVGYGGSAANINIYGGLYTYWVTNVATLCPAGWHVPVETDWATLRTFTGGDTYSSNGTGYVFPTAGVKLKNIARNGTNDYGFSALGGGKFDIDTGSWAYTSLSSSYWWVANSAVDSTHAKSMNDSLDSYGLWIQYPRSKDARMSVRCVKDVPYVEDVVSATCYDSTTAVVVPAVQALGVSSLSSNTYGYYPLTNLTNFGSTTYSSGTASNATTITGKFNEGYNLSGSNSNINFGSSASILQTSGQKTFSLWVKPTGGQAGNILSKYKTDTNEGGYHLQIDTNNRVSLTIKNSVNSNFSTSLSQSLSTTTWTHLAVTIDTPNSTIALYVNGDLVGTKNTSLSGTFTNANAPFFIGAEWYGGNSYVSPYNQATDSICNWSTCFYKGGVDDFFVVDKVLSDCEIKKLAKGPDACLQPCLTSCSGTNLIANNSFESGLTGFNSEYGYNQKYGGSDWNANNLAEGGYTVTTNPHNVHSRWETFSAYGGSGNMIVANGADSSTGSPARNKNIVCANISVKTNTNYYFSAEVRATYNPSSYPTTDYWPEAQLFVNNTSITDHSTTTDVTWTKKEGEWNSGATTTANFCVRTASTQGGGNDIAVDDLQVYEGTLNSCSVSPIGGPNPVNVQTGGGPGTIIGQSGYCGGNIYLSWPIVASSTKYHIYESSGVEVASTTNNQIVIKTTASSSHAYKLKSEKNGVLSTSFSTTTPWAVIASGSCQPPVTSISGTALCGGRIDLNWSSDSSLYRIDRAQCVQNVTDGSPCGTWNGWIQVNPDAGNSWIDTGLTMNKWYKYRITATSSDGLSSSAVTSAITIANNTACSSPFTCRIISPTANGKLNVNTSNSWTGTSTTNISGYAKDWTIIDNGVTSHVYDRNPLAKIFTTIGNKSVGLSVFGTNYTANCGTATTTVIHSGGIGEQ